MDKGSSELRLDAILQFLLGICAIVFGIGFMVAGVLKVVEQLTIIVVGVMLLGFSWNSFLMYREKKREEQSVKKDQVPNP